MDTALPQKFPFILDRNLAKAIHIFYANLHFEIINVFHKFN